MKRATFFGFMAVTLFSLNAVGQESATQEQVGPATNAKAVVVTPVALSDGSATLTPENTKVDFVGIHVGDDPKPRLGGFAKFTGSLELNVDGSLKSMSMEFETASLWTQNGDKLTGHLKNPDFLDVEKYPTAKFVSKSTKVGAKEGTVDIVGDFTLMEKTNEITIPATLTKTNEGVALKSEFKLDRATFGMDKMLDRVSKLVSITLSVGEKTTVQAAGKDQAENRGARGQRGGRSPGNMFKNQDKDGDGKLTGDEIPQFLKARVEKIDSDKDGSITLEEMQKAMGGRGGRGSN